MKYALIKGLVDNEVREELLSQSSELNLRNVLLRAKEKLLGLLRTESGLLILSWLHASVLIDAKMELDGFCNRKLVSVMQLHLSVAQVAGG